MQFGKVIGNVVSTCKVDNLQGLRLLVVQHLDEKLNKTGKVFTCTDTVNAKIGNIVLTCSSSSARMTQATHNKCTDNAIIGIVDLVSQKKQNLFNHNA